MRVLKFISAIFFFTVLFSCKTTTGSSIITGETRPAISPTDVKIYLDPPSEYETIGLVEASGDVEFSRQAAQDKGIDELKSQAAKIGANGVLLISTGSSSGETMLLYAGGGILFPVQGEKLTAQGRAIYVIQE